jgi:uncharacterized protein (TIGR02147 family)
VNSPGKSTFKKLEASQLQMFRRWYAVVIREMLSIRGFRGDPGWIAGQLLPKVEPREVEEALAQLLSAGLIKRTSHGYVAADPDVTTDDEVRSFLVKSYHAQMIGLAAWAQDGIPGKERDISSVCFPIKETDLPNLKKQLQLMRKELKGFAAAAKEGDRIVQVNIQMFPLTRAKPA